MKKHPAGSNHRWCCPEMRDIMEVRMRRISSRVIIVIQFVVLVVIFAVYVLPAKVSMINDIEISFTDRNEVHIYDNKRKFSVLMQYSTYEGLGGIRIEDKAGNRKIFYNFDRNGICSYQYFDDCYYMKTNISPDIDTYIQREEKIGVFAKQYRLSRRGDVSIDKIDGFPNQYLLDITTNR
ncbi:MAG TPA: hypothetical protein PKK43_05615 [Spirochaetota bacterium]|nr:hypothetical protein [Spirochaetota bacterium]